ncbi:hypothetical protein cco10_08908, partial [Campylobacter coli 90-3]
SCLEIDKKLKQLNSHFTITLSFKEKYSKLKKKYFYL